MGSKADKRRRRKARGINRALAAQAATITRSAPMPPQEDPRGVVLDARCRQHARTNREAVASDMWGDPAGQALAIGVPDTDTARRLWSVYKAVDAADSAYAARYVGIRRFPAVSRLEMLPERFETRDDDRPDYRTSDERDRDVVRVWMIWQGHLGWLSATYHTAVVDAIRQRVRLTHAGQLTRAGAVFVAAMIALDDVVQRR